MSIIQVSGWNISVRQEHPGARPKGASMGAEGDSLTVEPIIKNIITPRGLLILILELSEAS